MTATHYQSEKRFYRDRDRAVLGGVCAGLAEYLGFNLKVTRILAFIAFLMAMPIAVIGYLAAVFLIPSASRINFDADTEKRVFGRRRRRRKARKKAAEAEAAESTIADEIDERCRTLDERLARLEKHVTSRRFQLDQELSRL